MKVLLLENIAENAVQKLQDYGLEIVSIKTSLDKSQLKDMIKDVNILGIRSRTIVDAEILDSAPNLLTIGCYCIGTNQVDLDACKRRGIPVFNSPYQNSRSVAELIIAMIINLSRKIGDTNIDTHFNIWNKSAEKCYEIRGKTLGIVGFGHVGSQVSLLAEPFGMKILYYDILNKMPLGNSQPLKSLEDLLKISDYITLHVPETEKTKGMISENELSLMKKGSYLLNASRGSVVILEDLIKYLKNDHLAGAYIDVYPEEPVKNTNTWQDYLELKNCSNVILTPHIGGSTQEAQDRIGLEVSQKLGEYVTTGSTQDAVNFPNILTNNDRTFHRILNIHKNVPGVLKTINEILSVYNIEGQILKTDNDIGYLIVDVNHDVVQDIVEKINKLEWNIKTRVLF